MNHLRHYQVNLLAEARQFRNTIETMTAQLVEDPYFPHTFPYIVLSEQAHGAIPLPENDEEDGDDAAPILVQIVPPDDAGFIIEGVEEEPEEDPMGEPMKE
ncbi:hypothetical protein RHMOL_Rhmol09G0098300 [Rhododendron molle]|uniref:Uncharacterized protein n=1 Tax=Rhododendron molle TaxID=49168 RepID=A0ACC0MBV2_RHOML|nr:hypothetical protein RHMOL_Rhmol09G0098300 [Rhododendron molle]